MNYNKLLKNAQCSDLARAIVTDYETINNNVSTIALYCVS